MALTISKSDDNGLSLLQQAYTVSDYASGSFSKEVTVDTTVCAQSGSATLSGDGTGESGGQLNHVRESQGRQHLLLIGVNVDTEGTYQCGSATSQGVGTGESAMDEGSKDYGGSWAPWKDLPSSVRPG